MPADDYDRDRDDRDDRYRDDDYNRRGPARKYDEEGHEITSDDTMWGLFCHIGMLVAGFLAPLIIFFVYKDKSPFVTRHAKAALNNVFTHLIFVFGWLLVSVGIGFAVYGVSQEPLAGFITGYVVGMLGVLGLAIWRMVLIIIATIAASKGQYYRYPMSISFLG